MNGWLKYLLGGITIIGVIYGAGQYTGNLSVRVEALETTQTQIKENERKHLEQITTFTTQMKNVGKTLDDINLELKALNKKMYESRK